MDNLSSEFLKLACSLQSKPSQKVMQESEDLNDWMNFKDVKIEKTVIIVNDGIKLIHRFSYWVPLQTI